MTDKTADRRLKDWLKPRAPRPLEVGDVYEEGGEYFLAIEVKPVLRPYMPDRRGDTYPIAWRVSSSKFDCPTHAIAAIKYPDRKLIHLPKKGESP